MKKPELASEKGKIKEAKDPAGWYMGHELLSPPLSFCLHPYLQEISRYYFKARDRFIIK